MPKKQPHVNALWTLVVWLIDVCGAQFVSKKAPMDVAAGDNAFNEPEPDAIVLSRRFSEFSIDPPQPGDVRLVIEVSNTTLWFDTSVKARLYARAGIPQYWVLDVNGRRLIVHRQPAWEGYGMVTAYGVGERVSPLAAPDRELAVAEIIGI